MNIKQDYAQPMQSNALTAFGYISRVLAKFAGALLLTIILGVQIP